MNVGEFYNPHRMFTGIYIPDSLACSKAISPGAKLCFGRLCFYSGRKGECFPSLETLGEDIGVSERSAQAYVLELETQGFVRRFRRGPASNTYRFVWHQELEDSLKIKDPQDPADQEITADTNDRQNPVERSAKNRSEEASTNKVLREALREEENNSFTVFSEEPEPELRGKPFLDQFYRAHKRGGGKVDWNAKAEHNAWLMEQSETDEAILSALERFLDDAYWRKGSHHLAMFRRNFARYLEAEDPTVDQELSLISFRAAYDSTGAVSIQSDWDKARVIWLTLTESDRAKASSRVVEYDPAFIKSPRNYLRDREFDRPPRPAPKSNLEKLMEMA